MTTTSRPSDKPFRAAPSRTVVAGAAVAVAFVIDLILAGRPLTGGLPIGGGDLQIAGALALLVGFVLLRPSVVRSRGVRAELIAGLLIGAGAIGLALALESRITTAVVSGPGVDALALVTSPGFRLFSNVMVGVQVMQVVLAVVAAVLLARTPGADRRVRWAVGVVAAVLALPVLRDLLLDAGVVLHLVTPGGLVFLVPWYAPAALVLAVAGILAGAALAWPWLGPQTVRARHTVARAYRRYRDSTP
ncbi:hypothetical protein [Frondihabitans cladoniiphilus]